MEKIRSQFNLENSNVNLQQIISFAGADGNHRSEIESDGDTLEPFDDETEDREIDSDDPDDLTYWAKQFQISVNDLKAAIVLNGNSLRAVKKYLSV